MVVLFLAKAESANLELRERAVAMDLYSALPQALSAGYIN